MNVAKTEFVFHTSLELVEITGKKARNVSELLQIIRTIDAPSILYHTHRYFREHHFIRGEYSSDFAVWAMDSLQERALGERLAAIDIHKFSDVESLRNAIAKVIEVVAQGLRINDVPKGEEFYFCRAISIVFPTGHRAKTLEEFVEALEKGSINSIYFHLFESPLRLKVNTNDFSNWIEDSVGDRELARKIERLDPYFYTLDELRNEIIKLILKR